MPNKLLEKSGEITPERMKNRGQLLIDTERMKQLGQSRSDAQLWMCLVVKVKSVAVENNIA